MSWVSLHTHSQYSVLDALASVEALAAHAAEQRMPALALTDHGNLYGAIDFYLACQKVGIKPIIGCEIYVAPTSRHEKKKVGQKTAYHLTLLAKDRCGYRNLCQLSSLAFIEGFYYHPRVDRELLAIHHQGLICLSGCLSSEVAQVALQSDEETLGETIAFYQDLFGDDYYLELQRHEMAEADIETDGFLQESWLYQQYDGFIQRQKNVNQRLLQIAHRRGIQVVATNDIHYLARDDWRAHEVLLNIQSGEPCVIWEKSGGGSTTRRVPNPRRRTYASHELYFKSAEQMKALFADLPRAIETSLEIANKCCLELDFKARHYPIFVPPALRGALDSEDERREATQKFLRQLCEEAIPQRYGAEQLRAVAERYPGEDPLQVVRDRLELEMNVILPKDMCDYLLVVWDFINWAKKRGIPVGPGRGSGAGSIILYLVGITDIEPLRFSLFFERFINPERLSYPDIDVDICMERRGEVIDYTVQQYGSESVAQIITFGTMKAKMAIKDVGRVLSVPLAKVNAIAKLVPEDPNMTLDRAFEVDPDLVRLYEEDQETREVIDLARRLEGSVRNTGIHAAGVIVVGGALTDYIPLCVAKDSPIAVTQYSMKPLEKVGMLKIDFLGLKTLTCIEKAVNAVRRNTGIEIDPLTLPLDDVTTFNLLNQGRTLGIFQMESGGMQDLARQLHLDRFEEVIAVVALYRPGPMELIPSFINRKHGREAIEYDHPWLIDILSETYGVMVYQEQVMQIAQKLAGFSLGEGDVLRRAMGKKIMEEMTQQREKFRAGAVKNGINEQIALQIFDRMEQFAKYGFNKSHAASYALLTYITAYLKANYPVEWMAALMTCDGDDTAKVARFIRECTLMGIAVLPPTVNEAGDAFVATPEGIRFAISGIRGVGHGVVEAIVEARQAGGAFTGLYDFIRRIDPKRVGKKVIETLVEAGCFDFTGWSRDQLLASLPMMFDAAMQEHEEHTKGILNLFSTLGGGSDHFQTPPAVSEPTSVVHRLMREKQLLGLFLTGHPMEEYREITARLGCVSLSALSSVEGGTVIRTAFMVDGLSTRIASKSGRKFSILTISDGVESYELPIWPDLYEEKGHLLAENQLLFAVIQLDEREGNTRLICKWFDDLSRMDGATIEAADCAFDQAKQQAVFRGATRPLAIQASKSHSTTITLSLDLERVKLSEILQIKELLQGHAGKDQVQLHFLSHGKLISRLMLSPSMSIESSGELKAALNRIGSLLDVACIGE
jgi:DNA polymerase III subunit alpha